MYISIDMYSIITDTLMHYYCILVNCQLVFWHFIFSSKSKLDNGYDRKNTSRNILKLFYSREVILKGCQWLVLMKANKSKFSSKQIVSQVTARNVIVCLPLSFIV